VAHEDEQGTQTVRFSSRSHCCSQIQLLLLPQNLALLFPSVIAMLMLLRTFLLPRIFKPKELQLLDSDIA
jgi:hypothetical protein